MSTLGLIGSGKIGGTVARLAVAAGHEVVLSNSRGPETLTDLVADLGPRARAGTAAEAAASGDVVVVTIPFRAYADVPVEPLADKVVIDTNNYYPQRDGRFPELDDGSTTSSELLARQLPSSHVVKAFNNIFWGHLLELGRPTGSSERTALPIAADSPDAKRLTTELFDSLGYDAVDVGALSEGWRYQPDTPAYGVIYFVPDYDPAAVDIATGTMPPPAPTPRARVERALAAATR